MLSSMLSFYLIPFFAAIFLAINMGGSGTAPSFSPAYGSNVINKRLMPILFGLFVFLGALLAGKKVMLTVSNDVLPASVMGITLTTILLLAVSLSLLIANLLNIPQSTSQSTVFALVAPALYFNMLQKDKLLYEIIPAWFILPVIAFFVTLFIGKCIHKPLRKKLPERLDKIANHFSLKIFIISACCYVAFAIGSNNVANASGPISSMISNKLHIPMQSSDFLLIMILTTLIIAPCFGFGSLIFGQKVAHTTGKDIVVFGPLGASLIAIVTATLLLLASITKGIPTSLVQVNVAATIALGICKEGWKKMANLTSIKKLLTVWIIAPIVAFCIAFVLTFGADKMGLL
ncbi:MAG: anion permease [bacterium]